MVACAFAGILDPAETLAATAATHHQEKDDH
jgi:hypothetical protein